MAMDGSDQRICSSPSSSSSSSHDQQEGAVAWSKRPAGRTKFKETRHPVYRGVRHRGPAGRWVCEVRVPGRHGKRLWLGTHLTAESAGRAHDAAMLALLHGNAAACLLNFPDSAGATPPALGCAAALVAVADFLSREAAAAVPEVISIVSVVPVAVDDTAAGAWPSFVGVFEVVTPIAMGRDMLELDMPSEMDLGMHYADLAEGLLMEPPPDTTGASRWESGDYGEGDPDLWSY